MAGFALNSGLEGQTALVTGASGGIGQAIARALAAEGVAVALHAHRNLSKARTLADELGGEALPVQADLRSEAETDAMMDAVLGWRPRLDHVIVNAGIWEQRDAPLHRMSLDQWRGTLDADLTSAFLTCRAFLRHLAAQPREHASLVLVGSTAALFGEARHADYSAAKAGMVYGLTRSLKNEIVHLAPRGRVNCVCPGWTRTPMTEAPMQEPGAVEHVTSTMSLKKVATPEDVAAAAVFLSSERLAGHLTGTIVPVAGGMEGRRLESPA